MSIKEKEFVVFDLETTGLNPKAGDRICEIGAVKVKNGQIISSFSYLVNPERPIPNEAVCIHGITNKEVKNEIKFSEIIGSFLDFIKDYPLLGYNLKFDLGFLDFQLKLINKKPVQNPCIDVLFLCRKILSKLPKFNLGYVADYLGVNYNFRHRAFEDAQITAEVFLKLIFFLEKETIYDFRSFYSEFGFR